MPSPPSRSRRVFSSGASLPPRQPWTPRLRNSRRAGAAWSPAGLGVAGRAMSSGRGAAGRAGRGRHHRPEHSPLFLHQDSADLLPLDALRRLGSSKDLQPRTVVQRRLVEEGWNRHQSESPRDGRGPSRPEMPALLINCKCRDQVLRVAVDTGTQHNQISAACLSRLGLEQRGLQTSAGGLASGAHTRVEEVELQLGQETVVCSAHVVDAESPEFCLGLQTLLALKCCIDLERGVLRPRAPFPELPFLPLQREPGP
ncbi:nuclear receptor-interacting protein 2 isoform X2 [Erinaceus europaeus]|uniref:Nuclear receptor-interacting protein 2 isoform X2 n=1 Tax=Erinaceus europaeus TaxID=9365 RepID=A0A1S2ZXX5_ERIEU|nr:nuclear receptor-interacting protein 2 isoform X2 [Erinaceus europaeus]